MSHIDNLIEYFRQFPGIGPRQAKRFVYFLLTRQGGYRKELARLIEGLDADVSVCKSCFRFFPVNSKGTELCPICTNSDRDISSLMIVLRDVDFENVEKSHFYKGKYFVLGGGVPILEAHPEEKIRIRELLKILETRSKDIKEIILAMSLTAEGENTEDYLRGQLAPFVEKYKMKISTLGRGLSTGTELEYSDSETIKNALKNRN